MSKENPVKNLPQISTLQEKKKKVISHLVNLECKKEQLSILIERLTSISTERKNLISFEQGQNILSKLFSMGDQLKQAEKNKNQLEAEITQAKEQIESLNTLLGKEQA